eukprot:SAG31_NODE_15759_length_740_cov_0.937598_1_plen_63_part_00
MVPKPKVVILLFVKILTPLVVPCNKGGAAALNDQPVLQTYCHTSCVLLLLLHFRHIPATFGI